MKKLILFVLLFTVLYAETTKIDSLEIRLNSLPRPEKIGLLLSTAKNVMQLNPQKALEYSQRALKIAKTKEEKAKTYKLLGASYFYLNDYVKTLKHYEEALAIFTTIENFEEVANIFGNIGSTYLELNDYDNAIKYQLKALEKKEKIDNKLEIGKTNLNIGNIYAKMKNYEKAKQYFLKAKNIFSKLNNKKLMMAANGNLAIVYPNLNQPEKAIKLFLENIDYYKNNNDIVRLSNSFANLGDLYNSIENYEKSLIYSQKALDIFQKYNHKEGIYTALHNINCSQIRLKNYKTALNNSNEELNLAKELDNKYYLFATYSNMIDIYKGLNNFKQAYAYLENYTLLNDSLKSEKIQTNIAEFETKHQTIKNKKEIAELKVAKLQIIKQRLFLLIFVLLLFIITIIAFYFLKLKHRLAKLLKIKVAEKNSELQKELMERQKIEKKLMDVERFLAMREISAGIAHEVKNPLTSISSATQMLQDKPITPAEEEAFLNIIAESVNIATNTIIKMLDFTKTKDIDLQNRDTKFLLNRVCKLLRGNFKSNQVTLENKNNLPNLMIDEEYIQSVFVNVINNAINAMPNGGNLTISSATNNDKLYLKFIDNGCGIKPELLEKVFNPFFTTRSDGHGLGLSIANQAMKQHGGTIEITSELNVGTTVTLIFPLIEA